MAVAFVKRICSATDTASTNPKPLTVSGTTTAGNRAVFVGKGSSGIKANSATDSRSNAWGDAQAASNTTLARASTLSAQIATAILNGDTITVTFSAGNSAGMAVFEYSGLATSSPVDVQVQSNGSSGTAPTGGSTSITTTFAGETLIFATLALGTNATITAPTGWTLRDTGQSGNASGCVQTFEKIVSGAGTYAFDPSWGSSTAWSIEIVAYKAASSTVSASGTATLDLTASTTAQAPVTSGASLSLTASATASGAPTATAALDLTAAATGSATPTGTASLTLTATGTATATPTATASITLNASATPSTTATASLTLTATATGAGTPSGTSTASITLLATSTGAAPVGSTATLTLIAAGGVSAATTSAAMLTLSAVGVAVSFIATPTPTERIYRWPNENRTDRWSPEDRTDHWPAEGRVLEFVR